MIYLMLLINILLLVTGQILWKKELGAIDGFSMQNIKILLASPYIWGGLFLYVIATLIWFYILSKGKLSIVYPLQSFAYVFGVLAAWLIFQEAIPVTRWIGVGFLMLGAFFIAVK